MDSVRLRLQYDLTCLQPFMKIVYQDEELRARFNHEVNFSVGSWQVKSAACPAISFDCCLLWLRGEEKECDNQNAWTWKTGKGTGSGTYQE